MSDLKNWKDGDKFTGIDYTYERNQIADRIITVEEEAIVKGAKKFLFLETPPPVDEVIEGAIWFDTGNYLPKSNDSETFIRHNIEISAGYYGGGGGGGGGVFPVITEDSASKIISSNIVIHAKGGYIKTEDLINSIITSNVIVLGTKQLSLEKGAGYQVQSNISLLGTRQLNLQDTASYEVQNQIQVLGTKQLNLNEEASIDIGNTISILATKQLNLDEQASIDIGNTISVFGTIQLNLSDGASKTITSNVLVTASSQLNQSIPAFDSVSSSVVVEGQGILNLEESSIYEVISDISVEGQGILNLEKPSNYNVVSNITVQGQRNLNQEKTVPYNVQSSISVLGGSEWFLVYFVDWDSSTLKVQQVEYNGTATPPTDPTRSGYSFNGWDGSYTNVTSTRTIFAKYILIPQTPYIYRITDTTNSVTYRVYNQDSRTLDIYVSQTDSTPDTNDILLDDVTNFRDYTISGLSPGQLTRLYARAHIYNDWTGTFVVSGVYQDPLDGTDVIANFYADGVLISSQNVEYGFNAVEPSVPDKPGFEFVGWTTTFTNMTTSKNIHAVYEPIDYEIRFARDYNNTTIELQYHPYNSFVDPSEYPNPYISGYVFDYWSDPNGFIVTGNKTVTAYYYQISSNDYSITTQGGVSTLGYNQSVTTTLNVLNGRPNPSSYNWYVTGDISGYLTIASPTSSQTSIINQNNSPTDLSGTLHCAVLVDGVSYDITYGLTLINSLQPVFTWVSGGSSPTVDQTCDEPSDDGNIRCTTTCNYTQGSGFFSTTNQSTTPVGCVNYVGCTYVPQSMNYLCFTYYASQTHSDCETCEVTYE